ncbi:MAG: hypothetical protein NZ869_01975 [Thermoanaerobaculum sp.]|nr:hypothetical protein [Thermoanaerobaculum sp.]MDW7966705.1 biotin/lipoyl-containing protein [Thermoanaerobaculum sp.]
MIRRFFLDPGAVAVVCRATAEGFLVEVEGRQFRFALEVQKPGQGLVITQEGQRLPVYFARHSQGGWHLFFRGQELTVHLVDALRRHSRVSGAQRQGEELRAPIPGRVVQVLTPPGTEVQPGTPVLVLEAMKMQNLITTQAAGVVEEVLVQPGNAVEQGQLLAVVGGGSAT